MKYFFLLLIGSTFWLPTQGQEILENNPTSIRWYKLVTPNFRVIYPKGFEIQAQRMANSLESIRQEESNSLGGKTRRTSVILQNQSAVSNGFVSMVPRRSEFYAMPTQNYNFSGTNDWLDLLASHEFRHVVQFDVARRGFNSALYYLFGPATFSAMAQTSVPQWFWEGDAVVTETVNTRSGRGRIPNFGLVFRTNLLEGRNFNYHKQYLRSYKDFIPNHYVLGYHMVSYLRKKTNDPNSWERISKDTWSVPFIPFGFSSSIKKESGLYVTQLYNEMAKSLKNDWQKQLDSLQLTTFETVAHAKRKGYTDYNFPQVLGDGRVVAMKEGIGNIENFVGLSDSGEEKIFTPGILNESGMLSASGPWIVWNEHTFDPRWRVRNYSVIKMYNVQTKELKKLTRRSRYAGAALNPDQSKIVTVSTATDYQSALTVLDLQGRVIKQFPNSRDDFYSMARWSQEGADIVALKTNRKGRSVVIINYESGQEQTIISEGEENIGHPVLTGKYLLFNSGVTGIDNIYAINIETRQRYQVTCSKYGAYNPCLSEDGTTLYYNDQTRNGLDVVRVDFDPAKWKPWKIATPQQGQLSEVVTNQDGNNLFAQVSSSQIPAKRYRKISGLINPYSWGAVFDQSFTKLNLGISSRDILSTTSINLGYLFDVYERTGEWRAGLSYQGLFPIFDFNFIYAKRKYDEGDVGLYNVTSATNDTTIVYRNVTFEWTERTIEGGVRLPLLTTRSKYNSGIEFGNYLGYTQVSNFGNNITDRRFVPLYIVDGVPTGNIGYPFFDYVDESSLKYNHFSVSAYRLLKQSHRDINSRWGVSMYIDYFNTPFNDGLEGSMFSFLGITYLPGLMKHHSLWGYWAYQHTMVETSFNDYIFRNNVPGPRGVSIYRFEKFYSMSANYTLPLIYPDISIGPLLNLQRIRANLFLDYGFGNKVIYYNIANQTYASTGVELKVDFNVMRALPQLNVGVRYSYGLKPSVTKFEILIGTINF